MHALSPVEDALTLPQQDLRVRILCVKRAIAAHESNMALLQAFAQGQVTLQGKGYTRGAENYRPRREDKARLPRTLANLRAQRDRLRQELALLLEYGT